MRGRHPNCCEAPDGAIASSALRPKEFEHFSVPLSQRAAGFPPSRLWGAGQILARQGELLESVFLVERGLVKLIRGHPDGHSERIVGLRAEGWIIGAAAAIAYEPWVATAVSAVPSRVAQLPATDFRRILAEDQTFSSRIYGLLAREVSLALEQLGEDVHPARERLEHLLRALVPADDRHPVGRNDLPLKQWEIAQLVGVRPQYLSTLLAELGLDGAFRGHGGGQRRRETRNSG